MKRLVFLLAVLAGVIIAVWTTAAVVLDPQRFKAEFAKALERTFEHPVDVGHLEVRWDSLSHLTLEVREIVVYSDAERKALPFLRANRVEANLSLWRLFKKEIRLNKVFIESPFVRVIAVEPGRVLVAGAVMPAKKPAAAGGV
ncbi:MAG: hypothetical protein WCG06_01940, partial [Candidatus Omnitrophota bacterium]